MSTKEQPQMHCGQCGQKVKESDGRCSGCGQKLKEDDSDIYYEATKDDHM
jgi:predicted amidophosphoribosyltransferase